MLLIELQKVDNELQTLEELKGDLPQKVKQLQNELHAIKQNHQTCKKELEETRRLKLHGEGEIKDFQEKQNKYREQLYAVKSNREYDAITLELDAVKEKIDQAETQVLELMDREQNLTANLQNLDSQVALLTENLTVKEKELQEKIAKTEDDYRLWQKKRQELIVNIKKPILSTYERIRRVRGKNTVVEINKYACGGCHSAIPPQKAVEIRNMDQLILCESCGRILVYKNEPEPVAV
jgi:hypothetical protein